MPPHFPPSERPAVAALITAIFTESTRLIWPAPTPTVWPSARENDGVGFHMLADFPSKEQGA